MICCLLFQEPFFVARVVYDILFIFQEPFFVARVVYDILFIFQEPFFVARVVYDMLFFFIIIIIVLNLIFGVIIDTFADLRSEKQNKEEILKNTCFICGKFSDQSLVSSSG